MDTIADSVLMIALICQLMLQGDTNFLEDFKEAATQHVTVALAIKSTAKHVTTVCV